MDSLKLLTEENQALKQLVSALGFDPTKVTAAYKNGMNLCEERALVCQFVFRDFSRSGFSQKGIDFGNSWLDTLLSNAARSAPSGCKGCAGDGLVTRDMGDHLPENVWCPCCSGSGRRPNTQNLKDPA